MELTLGEEQVSTFKQALERVSAFAHAKLPAELHGNLERAHALVLHRHVWMDEDGKHGQVLSSDGATWYVCNGHCTCMGTAHAPQGLCKHRLSVALYRRASELLASSGGSVTPAAAAALPEAPASVNVRLCIHGAEVQWTLRDQDEHRLAERLEALLTRFPQKAKDAVSQAAPQSPAQSQGETPTCQYHGAMRESTKVKGTFYCPSRMGDGTFCKEKFPKK